MTAQSAATFGVTIHEAIEMFAPRSPTHGGQPRAPPVEQRSPTPSLEPLPYPRV
jgi:hypothetical protein